jgi:bifunctional DNA-binding transcriptional regulator/antitoxin component of YhaV-PrlF toxin-antitoxin module
MEYGGSMVVKLDSQYRITFPRKWVRVNNVKPGMFVAIKPKILELVNVEIEADELDRDVPGMDQHPAKGTKHKTHSHAKAQRGTFTR